MYIITLTLTELKTKAREFMEAHNRWITAGLEDGLFLVVGGLKPQGGGVILAHKVDRQTIEMRVAEDPFVQEGIVTPHIQNVSVARSDPRFEFLLDHSGAPGT